VRDVLLIHPSPPRAQESSVRDVLLIAGDVGEHGAFASSAELLDSGLLQVPQPPPRYNPDGPLPRPVQTGRTSLPRPVRIGRTSLQPRARVCPPRAPRLGLAPLRRRRGAPPLPPVLTGHVSSLLPY
jgi:hypothetical protein